ncbi:hypothetical protein [Conexibacter sp. DBS9H8]|uniref:hypothetical protein n=1 Tax=Conexibacter sp. DBS9H8 TaxID=2937801 RepID=UPI00200E2FC0|nr:hypothetical protein [Conexibacter sp. DBS9H8]
MGDVGVIWAAAPSLDKLEKELSNCLVGYDAEEIISVSHSVVPRRSRRTGGLWGAATETNDVEYSAVVLVRT